MFTSIAAWSFDDFAAETMLKERTSFSGVATTSGGPMVRRPKPEPAALAIGLLAAMGLLTIRGTR